MRASRDYSCSCHYQWVESFILIDFPNFPIFPHLVTMKYVAAYLLADLAGTQNPTAADLSKILKSVGIEVDAARAKS